LNGQKSKAYFEEKGSKVTEVLITGGSGFLGINLTKKLLEKGQNVKIYDTHSPPKEIEGKVKFVKGDIRDQDNLKKALKDVQTVYHTVALVPISNAGKAFREINVEGTEITGRAALNEKVKKFVHISSSSIYDLSAGTSLTEKSPVKEGGEYEQTKYHGELKIQELIEKGLPATIIRPRTIIGPGRGGVFQILYDWIMRGKRIYIIGKGDNKFQMISASDLCDACILAAESDKSAGEIFNIGADQYETLKEDLVKLIQHAGTSSKILPLPARPTRIALSILYHLGLSPLVPWHYNNMHKSICLDTTKAKQVLGWKPKQSNQDMLIESYDWYIEHCKELETGTSHRQAPAQKILKWLRRIS